MSSREGRKSVFVACAFCPAVLPLVFCPEMRRANRSGPLAAAERLAVALGRLLGKQRDRLVECHRARILALRQGRVDLAVIDVGAVAAVAHGDLAAVRMLAERFERSRRAAIAARPALRLLLG